MIRDDPGRSELIRIDPTRTGDPSWSSPTFVPAFSKEYFKSKTKVSRVFLITFTKSLCCYKRLEALCVRL